MVWQIQHSKNSIHGDYTHAISSITFFRHPNCFPVWLHTDGVLMFSGLPATAHPYLYGDYWPSLQSLAADMPNQLNGLMQQYVGCPLWSTNCNSQTAVYLSVAGQDGPN